MAEDCSSARSLTRVLVVIVVFPCLVRAVGSTQDDSGFDYSAAGRNWSCSVDSFMAVVDDRPPVMASDTASK